MDYKIQLNGMKSAENPIYGLIGFVLPLAAVIIGSFLAAISWSPVSAVMNQSTNAMSFIIGVVLILTGVFFYSSFLLVRRFIAEE